VSAHTPGPWVLGNENNQCCDVECGDGRTSVSLNRFDSLMRDESHISRAERLANARLIAAAPDLLAALKGLRAAALSEYVSCDCPNASICRPSIKAADAAIAKAEGES